MGMGPWARFFSQDALTSFAAQNGPLVYALLFVAFLFQVGFLIGPVLPGNPIVFLAGVMSFTGILNLSLVIGVLSAGVFVGNLLNYYQGSIAGPQVAKRRAAQIEKAEAFFTKHGPRTVALAPLVPFYRAFVPFVAGLGRMPIQSFALSSLIGSFLWIGTWALLGYFLGQIPAVRDNVDKLAIAIVLIVSVVAIVKLIQSRRAKST